MAIRRLSLLFLWLLNACATLQVMRYYVVSTHFYLNMPAYLSGNERLPFQQRVLPILLMWPINHSAWIMRAAATRHSDASGLSAATTATVAFYLLSLVSCAVAGLYAVRLYKAVTQSGVLVALVYPAFLMVVMWTYLVHVEANYSYPYDLPSLAFFTAGLYYIYQRRFWALLIVFFLGTFNRETTLFLIGIYMLDAASTRISDPAASLRDRFSPRTIEWTRVALLTVVWVAIKLALTYRFAHNDASENYIRVAENLHRLKPRLLPSLLNMCGYLLPAIWVLKKQLRPVRFANYLYILPFWLAVMFVSGVILETRIYGELTSFAAIAAVLLLEEHVRQARNNSVADNLNENHFAQRTSEGHEQAVPEHTQAA